MGSLQAFNNAVFNHPALANYEKACALIAQCAATDSVAEITCPQERYQAYTRQATNLKTEAELFKIRMRAEREAGAELLAIKEAGLLAKNQYESAGTKLEPALYDENQLLRKVTLDDLGETKKTSTYRQACASAPQAEFDEKVERAAQQIAQGKRSNKLLPISVLVPAKGKSAEKPRKKATVIAHKEAAVEADFESADAEHLTDETFQSLYEAEMQENTEKSEKIAALEAEAARLCARLLAFEQDAKQAANAELVQKIAALGAENAALKREIKAVEVTRDFNAGESARYLNKYKYWKKYARELEQLYNHQRPQKVGPGSTYCTGSGYSDENDPRHIEWLNKQKEKALADELANGKAAVNQEKKQAAQWLSQNNVPADGGYRFNGKQAVAQVTREKFADNRPKPESVPPATDDGLLFDERLSAGAPAEEKKAVSENPARCEQGLEAAKKALPESEWGKKPRTLDDIACREARALAEKDKLNIPYYWKCIDAGLSEAAALNCAKLTSPNPLLTRYGRTQP